MLVVMQSNATEEQVRAVCQRIESLGLKAHPIPGSGRTAIGITGNSGADRSRSCPAGVPDSGHSHCTPRFLEPRILIGRVIDHEFGDHAQIALVRGVEERPEIVERAEIRINIKIIGNVITVVAHRRGIKWQQPDRRNAELLEIIQLFDQAPEVAHPIAIAVAKSFDVHLIDDRVLVPQWIGSPIVGALFHAFNFCHIRRVRNHTVLK